MKPFLCERYLLRLRDETADAPDGPRLVAHLWACGLLDARCDTLLLPVLVRVAELPESADPLLELLIARGLPPDWARRRLTSGACLILADRADDALMRRYPNCLFVTDADRLLQSSLTCR